MEIFSVAILSRLFFKTSVCTMIKDILNRMKNKLFFLVLLIFCFSCAPRTDSALTAKYWDLMKPVLNEKNKDSNDIQFDGETEPLFPDYQKNNSNFEGIDTNSNGVRDDVEIWINRSLKDSNVRKALKDLAKYTQLEAGEKNSVKSVEYLLKRYKAAECYDYVAINEKENGLIAFANMKSLLFNNVFRIKYSFREAGYGDIENLKLPSYEYCSFQIKNIEELKRAHVKN